MKTNLGINSLYLVLFLSIILFFRCKKDDDDDVEPSKEVYIGTILPLDVTSGVERINMIKTAVDEINESSKVLGGYKIKLDIRSSEPPGAEIRDDYAAKVAESILNDHPSNLIGFITAWSSSSRGVTLQVADSAHISVISTSSTVDSNTGLSDYFQRLAPPDKFQALISAKKAKTYGINTVAIAVEKDDVFSEGLALAFKENFEAEGGTIISTVKFIENDPEYQDKLSTLYEEEPDAVFTAMLSTHSDFFNEINDHANFLSLDIANLRFILSDAKYQDLLDKSPPQLLTGEVDGNPKVFGAASAPDITNPAYIHYKTEIKNRYGQDDVQYGPQSYDVVYLLALAMERALKDGETLSNINDFREAVNNNIRKVSRDNNGETIVSPDQGWTSMQAATNSGDVNYEGASGNCDIDEFGDVITNYEIFTIIDDGSGNLSFEVIENINPLDIK
jgi:neutral amino acid transport system substrate-binding protein